MPTVHYEGLDGALCTKWFYSQKRADEFVKKVNSDKRYAEILKN
jgi:hypothetical protein